MEDAILVSDNPSVRSFDRIDIPWVLGNGYFKGNTPGYKYAAPGSYFSCPQTISNILKDVEVCGGCVLGIGQISQLLPMDIVHEIL